MDVVIYDEHAEKILSNDSKLCRYPKQEQITIMEQDRSKL